MITTGERVQFPNSVSKDDFIINIADFGARVKVDERRPLILEYEGIVR